MRCRAHTYSLYATIFIFGLTHLSYSNPSLHWTTPYSSNGAIYSSPAIANDGTVYIGSNDKKLHAINADGSPKWTFTASDWIDSTPAIGADGTVYVGSWDNQLYAINPVDGTKYWDFNTSNSIIASPAVGVNGRIYFGSKDEFFYALESNGSVAWEIYIGQPISSSAALGQDGTIYFGDENGTFHALNQDGTTKWTYIVDEVSDSNKSILSSPALDLSGNIYFGSGNGYCYSLEDNNSNASLNWKYQTSDRVDTSPVLGMNSDVFFISRDGYIRSIDTSTGIFNWQGFVGDVFYSSPVVDSNGRVYVIGYTGSGENHLFAYDSNGNIAWDTNNSSSPLTIGGLVDSSLALDSNGNLFFGCYDNKVYAVNVGTGLADSPWPQFQRDKGRAGAWPSIQINSISFPTNGGSTSGGGTFNEGATVSLEASPTNGYNFNSWIADSSNLSTANPYQFNASTSINVTANFSLQTFNFAISGTTGGSVPTGLSKSYDYGTVVAITATPQNGYQFLSWEGNGISNPNSIDTNVTITGSQTASAKFSPIQYSLNSISSVGGSVNDINGSYSFGSQVTISATPDSGYSFSSWHEIGNSIADSSLATTSVTVEANQSIQATFTPLNYNFAVTAGNGGSVSSSPTGNTQPFASDVSVSAIPKSGYFFTGWSGSGVSDINASTTNVQISGNHTIVANFAQTPIGKFVVQISSNNNDAAANLKGSGAYNTNEVIQISAFANEGYTFANWSGATVTNPNEANSSVSVTQDLNLTANFTTQQYNLILLASTGGIINDVNNSYSHGSNVSISATPQTGYTFSGWEGSTSIDDIFANSTSITLTEDSNITASFKINSHIVSIYTIGAGSFTGSGIYNYGETITLTSEAADGSYFSGWSGEEIVDTNNSQFSQTLIQDLNITATFTEYPSQLNDDLNITKSLSNWYASNWFGYFYQSGNGWCYHSNLGWIYPVTQSDGSIWVWSQQLKWLWITPSTYSDSFVWSSTDNNWIYFDFIFTTGPRMYNFKDEGWNSFDKDKVIAILDTLF